MNKPNLLELARRTALEPWSTVDEKLGALAGLESIATPEAMGVLSEVMSLTGLYSKAEDKGSTKFPLNGEIAGAAARALARIESSEGIRGVVALLSMAHAENTPLALRECAIYGLGGGTGKEVFDCYSKLLNVPEPILLERLLASISESYKRIDCEHSPHAASFLVLLFDAISTFMDEGRPQSLIDASAKVIATALPERGRTEMFELARTPKKGSAALLAIEVITRISNPPPIEALTEVLKTSGFPARAYELVARRLSTFPSSKYLPYIQGVHEGARGLRGFLLKLSEAARDGEKVRIRVLEELLRDSPIARRG